MSELIASISLVYRAGDDLLLEFTVTRDGAAVNITGMTPRFVVRRSPSVDPVISTESSPATATATVTSGAGGVYQVAIDHSVTELLSGTYRFESDIEDGSDDLATVARGFVTFEPKLI